ncbi:hypothetical protein JTB14_027059 [Gonioctena quinquepunctata]|nr:hypothetical protein JTB14_027059 [Gonioctena quinquepunctata]
MSKLIVSLSHFIRPLFVCHKLKKYRYYPCLYLLSFAKSLRRYALLGAKSDEGKISRYWSHQTIPELLSLADKLYEQEKYIEVYELLDRIRLVKEPEVLWRIARVLYTLSCEKNVTRDIRWDMLGEAREVLDIAFSVENESADVHKWTAIVLDASNSLINLESRVKNFPTVRDHLERACELNPQDFSTHHMLGKWFFQMSQLNWFQRLIAKYFIASEPPKSSYDEAYRYLAKAEELQPRTFLPNIFLLGRTCIETGQFYKGKYYLNIAVSLPAKSDCEKCYVSKARYLIRKLEMYDMGKNVLFYDPLGFND